MNSKTIAMEKTVCLFEKTACTQKKWRPLFHLSPKTGWMNDPNGLCQHKGVYHIYFQYSPFDTAPGTNYWGHFSTRNFIDYDYHKPALYVDENFDCHGVYSGSAVSEEDGITVFYTGNVKQNGDFDYITSGREHNTISAFSKDGINFETKKLLMTNSDYPADCTCHVRDPKVWKENGIYYMVLGSRRLDDIGEVLVFSSADKENFKLCNRITTQDKFGFMWECPDLFTIGGQTFLAVSPQGVNAQGMKYNNIYQSGYFKLNDDFSKSCTVEDFQEYDHGFDFYAPQSFIDEKGRRILIGWLGLPDLDGLYENPTKEYGWVHMLTCPRVLSLNHNGRLCQYPVSELLQGNDEKTVFTQGDCEIDNLKTFMLKADELSGKEFSITIRKDCFITYKNNVMSLSFGKSGYGRKTRSAEISDVENLLILCDTSSVEIFVNNGEDVFSSRFYPEDDNSGVKYSGEKAVISYSPMK